MTQFIRVRAAVGPAHEFDAPTGEVEAHPSDYILIDSTPSDQPRPVKYILPGDKTPEVAAPVVVVAPEPSVGKTEKEGA